MTTPKKVYALLKDKHHIAARRYTGDYTASDILLDLDYAISLANLTQRQKELLEYLFEMDFTQEETAVKLGVRQHTVSANLQAALKKIAAVYSSWFE
ncbi:sigma factor-like helix-turn-helix DNA-binding protein [Bacillus horti]|uniref:DNA-directed RNA polymerase specialized sigma subunit n=1 Tax=Caldalkalibacillus horti TaxID=77523 RepID=A0ABT9W085_9BACI|nr:sigma factor-like helix-turn-helix DNA-binding protein [Bacillus horti]MDQ0166631.1 DNA-directed RNA polymerase specialized sigma subunit [Bacillus horti]